MDSCATLMGEMRSLLRQGEVNGAFLRLAEAHHLAPGLLVGRSDLPDLNSETRESVKKKATSDLRRAVRILSFGTTWESEEVLLVATIRCQLRELDALFRDVYLQELGIDAQALDEEISELMSDARFASQWMAAHKRIDSRHITRR